VAWLDRLRADLCEVSEEAARKLWPGVPPQRRPYYNYRLEHVRQVERDALRLLRETAADSDIALASVWIHDRFQPQFVGEDHAARAATWAGDHLADLGFPPGKVDSVCFAVLHHSDPPGTLPETAREARLLWDADKLAKIGALSMVTYLLAAPAFPHQPLTADHLAREAIASLPQLESRIESFYFDFSRRLARRRFGAKAGFAHARAEELGGLSEEEVRVDEVQGR